MIAASGGRWIFIGMESLDPANLASVNKSFNKPSEYAGVLQALARRNIYAITSFIFGLDHDTPGVAERTLAQIREWPPVLPVFGQITPFPATPLYARLGKEERLTRPKHWLEFAPFRMAHTPLHITIPEVQDEMRYAWTNSYSPAANEQRVGFDCERTGALQNQPPGVPSFLPRNLFSAKGSLAVAEADRSKPKVDMARGSGLIHSMARNP